MASLRIPPVRALSWIGFFAVILAAWAAMFMMAAMSGVDPLGRPVGRNMMPMTGFGTLFVMWALMMAAMMLPTLVPTLATYERLMISADGTRTGWLGLLTGYAAVWIGMAALLAGAQVGLLALGAIDALGALRSRQVAGGLMVLAGAYQFTAMKDACHGVCHAPMHYFLGHWRSGAAGGLRMGLGLGVFCAGCCWGYMLLGFAGGVMSLLWMGLATLLMILEKLPALGHRVIRPVGAVLIGGGLALAFL